MSDENWPAEDDGFVNDGEAEQTWEQYSEELQAENDVLRERMAEWNAQQELPEPQWEPDPSDEWAAQQQSVENEIGRPISNGEWSVINALAQKYPDAELNIRDAYEAIKELPCQERMTIHMEALNPPPAEIEYLEKADWSDEPHQRAIDRQNYAFAMMKLKEGEYEHGE